MEPDDLDLRPIRMRSHPIVRAPSMLLLCAGLLAGCGSQTVRQAAPAGRSPTPPAPVQPVGAVPPSQQDAGWWRAGNGLRAMLT